jgi:methionyl-tRNA formyltransferase
LSNNLKLLQPTNLKEESFLEELKSLNANLQVVVAFRMLTIPKSGLGDAKVGHLNPLTRLTGAIILSFQIAINPNENAGHLYDLMHLGSEAVIETLELIEKEM